MSRDIKGEIWDKTQLYIDSIGNVIVEAGKQMGVGAEHVYTVYTKQIMIEGIVYASTTLAIIIAVIIGVTKLIKRTMISMKDKKDDDLWFATTLITAVAIIAMGFFTYLLFIPNLLKALNPEFYTMQYLLDLAKSMLKAGK